MSVNFEELDYSQTHLGELILRRRRVPSLGDTEVFEVKLGDDFLMSSLFNTGEIALAELGLAGLDAAQLDVVVGGLGLGYTTGAALDHPAVRSVLVIEALAKVIDWHRRGLVPLGVKLTADQRCRLIHGDFLSWQILWGRASTLKPLAVGSTPFCWILITRRAICCTQKTASFTIRPDCANSQLICTLVASSLCGQTIRPTMSS